MILALILLALALPPAVKRKSWRWLLAALILSFIGVVLPLFIFFFSAFLSPESKSDCGHGWLDCFMLGKLALTPLVLVATAALYSVEILKVNDRTARWLVMGIFLGAIISTVCLVFGLLCIGMFEDGLTAWLCVPFYVAVWYSARAVQLVKKSNLGLKTYLVALLGSLPFWAASILWSQKTFGSLPDVTSGCFVVTAAGRGHRKWVGPFFETSRHGHRLQANQQLITLWQFEDLWRCRFPLGHRWFRHLYNHIGPFIAAQIRSPWVADVIFIALKPIELMARAVNPTQKIKDFIK